MWLAVLIAACSEYNVGGWPEGIDPPDCVLPEGVLTAPDLLEDCASEPQIGNFTPTVEWTWTDNPIHPGYHQVNGYMADVKTFFVGAVHGRIPGDEKNSLFLSLVPGQMDKKPLPTNPVPAGEIPTTEPDVAPPAAEGPKSDSGCGCVTVGTSPASNTAALAGVGLALGIVISRRRRNR